MSRRDSSRRIYQELTFRLADTELNPLSWAGRIRVKHFGRIVGQLKCVAVPDGYVTGTPVDQDS